MKKAVISTGSKQYLVTEGQVLNVELLGVKEKSVSFEPLLVIDGDEVRVGVPVVSDGRVTAEILEPDVKMDKVSGVRFKAKKRVHKVHGHRQRVTTLKVTSIV